jgi:flagellin
MPMVISTNIASMHAERNLHKNYDALHNSLNKLSSGQRINRPQDDAGGLSVHLRMAAAVQRSKVVKKNIQNGISFLQARDGVIENAMEVASRIHELRAMSNDPTKNSDDIENYNVEYQSLREHLINLQDEQFNGVAMFNKISNAEQQDTAKGGVYEIFTSAQTDTEGATSVTIEGIYLTSTQADLADPEVTIDAINDSAIHHSSLATNLTDASIEIDELIHEMSNLADIRARNGATLAALQHAYSQISLSKNNLSMAASRIMDVDMAEESANFARLNILTQASTSTLSLANTTPQTALKLLQG